MFIIDTHVFIWFASQETKKIPKKILTILESESNLFISVASIWEISIKSNLKKLDVVFDFFDIEIILKDSNISLLPIYIPHVKTSHILPNVHKDPFDRIIIAQAISEDFTIITKDENFKQYPVNIMW